MKRTIPGYGSFDSPHLLRRTGRSMSATESDLSVRTLLAIAVLLLAFALGTKLSEALDGSAAAPTRLTSVESDHLAEVRYLIWLDHARRDGAIGR